MYTPLATLRAQSELVVIGRVSQQGENLSIDVEKVLRGAARSGPLVVKPSPDGHVDVEGRRVVAFIAAGALRWVGERVAGPSIEHGVLRLRGFFDFNAHIVSPGLLSLEQLERLLRREALKQVFAIEIGFPDGKGGVAPSSRTLTVSYDPLTRAIKVSGLSAACLGAGPFLSGLDWGQFELSFSTDCPGSSSELSRHGNVRVARSRALGLEGDYTGLDAKTGAITVLVTPRRPMLRAEDFDWYLADGSIIDVERVVEVRLDDGSRFSWHLGQYLADPERPAPRGRLGQRDLDDEDGERPARARRRRRLRLREGEVGDPSFGGQPPLRRLSLLVIQLLEGGKLRSCRLIVRGQPAHRCTLAERPPVIVRGPRR